MRIPSVVAGTCEFAWDACPGGGAGGAESSLATAINAACCHCCSRGCLVFCCCFHFFSVFFFLFFLFFLAWQALVHPSINQCVRQLCGECQRQMLQWSLNAKLKTWWAFLKVAVCFSRSNDWYRVHWTWAIKIKITNSNWKANREAVERKERGTCSRGKAQR